MGWIQALKTRAAAFGFAAVLGACAAAFLALSAYFELAESLEPALAALCVGAALLVLALLVLAVARWTTGARRRERAGRGREHPLDELQSALEQHVDPVVGDWIRRHPKRAALAAIVLGVAAGYSGSARRVLQDMFNQYVEAEGERRSRRRN